MTAPSTSQLKPSILNALRKATALAISINPRTITLIPHIKTKVTGGRVDWVAQTPRAPQQFSIEPVASTLGGITGTTGGINAIDGASGHIWSYNLTGRWDSQMDIQDTWVDGDVTYKIIAIQPFNGYEKVAVVTAFGADPNYGS